MTVPTGSLSLRITSSPAAIASMRPASSDSRSRKAGVAPRLLASARSSALAARIVLRAPRIALAIAASARLFCAGAASASARAALRASRPMPRMTASSSASCFPEAATALSGAFMVLIRLAFGNFLPCPAKSGEAAGEANRGPASAPVSGANAHSNPQGSFACHRSGGTSRDQRTFSHRVAQTRGCHAFFGEPECEPPAQALSCRHDLCGRRPRRRRWGTAGVLPLCRAAGRPAHQSRQRLWRPSFSPRARRFPETQSKSGPKPGKAPVEQSQKNYCRCRNLTAAWQLTIRCRAKPPSPSPSITRRRTPAVLAAGVLHFRAQFLGQFQFTNLGHAAKFPASAGNSGRRQAVAARWRLCPWREGSRAGP